jgi:hypothetical protein
VVIWRQIRGELLGHLTMAGTPPLSTEHIIAQLQQLRELLPAPLGETMTDFDGPELAATKRLLDVAKSREFAFERIAPGPDGPLRGVRETIQFPRRDLSGWVLGAGLVQRHPAAPLVPGGLPVAQQLRGDALTVLRTVLWDLDDMTQESAEGLIWGLSRCAGHSRTLDVSIPERPARFVTSTHPGHPVGR